ncbi:Trifunctional nucleotide phosphoesterase protein YfkN [Halotydeus destructor]|nr:Trifunctional nucleotide phosphoesterase protein YfkN [Halotydeus destructor]
MPSAEAMVQDVATEMDAYIQNGHPSKTTILHFNDCYNVEPRAIEPAGGAARFKTALESFSHEKPLVLFSGDILGPSIMSTFTKGEQMICVLNSFGTHCAVYGNHDFDYGLDNLVSVTKQTNFPWLMSNVQDVLTNRPLAEGKLVHIMEKNGKRFGLIGLVEEEWLATLSTLDQEDVIYFDFVSEGRKLAKQLKEKERVDFVIALTHMRTPNDCRLAENVDEIDLILGGHDHDYEVKKVNGKFIIKSGTDFRQFSKIDIIFKSDKTFDIEIKEMNVNSTDFEEDENLKNELNKYSGIIEGKMDTLLGQFGCDLDGRFASIRTRETNLGNFVCDIMLASTHSDCAILNSGTLRSDRIHVKGDFKLRDLVTIMPMMDSMIVLSATGEQIWKALENGVSQWPKLEGRFPQVAGLKFAFDPTKPQKQRIDPAYIKIGDEYLDLHQKYRLVTKAYLGQGKDGYNVFKDCEVLVREEECPELCTSIQNHFEAIRILTSNTSHHTRHRQSLLAVSRRTSVAKMHDMGGNSQVESMMDATMPSTVIPKSPNFGARKNNYVDSVRKASGRKISVDEIEFEQCRLEPKVENRIIILTDEVLKRLQQERLEYLEDQAVEVIEEEPDDMVI